MNEKISKERKRKMKNSKGITLIALIITIVVLLIIAVVAIGAVQESNIIGHAQNAAESYNDEKAKEEGTLAGYEALIESKLPGGDTGGIATVGKIVDKNSTINGEAYSSTNPIIPAGFAAINITGTNASSWDAEGGPEVNKGLVITDNITTDASGKATIGSEFVWVPVSQINDMIMCQEHGASVTLDEETLQCPTCLENTKLAGKLYTDININSTPIAFDSSTTGQTYKNAWLKEPGLVNDDNQYTQYITETQLQNEFENMAKSVAKYGGFYVGRYEMSLTSGKTAQSKYGATSSDPSQTDTSMWYGLYTKSKTYVSTKSSVQSTMIWGSQYDAMMIWMENNGVNVNTNIGDLGNKERTSGTDSDDVIKNVYDLYGNSFEGTLEANLTGNRGYRGGDFGYSYSPSIRNDFSPTTTSSSIGSRLALYVELQAVKTEI